jgi:diaminopimelate epimerase
MNRTYERGVEDETLACGTGAVAGSLMSCLLRNMTSPVSVSTRGGDTLRVYFERYDDRFENIYLEGEAKIIYNGKLWKDAWQGGK